MASHFPQSESHSSHSDHTVCTPELLLVCTALSSSHTGLLVPTTYLAYSCLASLWRACPRLFPRYPCAIVLNSTFSMHSSLTMWFKIVALPICSFFYLLLTFHRAYCHPGFHIFHLFISSIICFSIRMYMFQGPDFFFLLFSIKNILVEKFFHMRTQFFKRRLIWIFTGNLPILQFWKFF